MTLVQSYQTSPHRTVVIQDVYKRQAQEKAVPLHLKFPNKQMEKIHVLLVEDEQTLAMIIKDTLEEQDFIITTAGDGEEGLRKFFEQKPDVLVADVMMPRMDGFEMVRRIRQSDKARCV